MKSTKIHSILSCLSPKDRKRFRDYLHSPFFNTRTDVITLFSFWEKHYSDPQKAPEWNKEEQIIRLSPRLELSPQTFQRLKTRLLNLLYGFLAHTALDRDKSLNFLLQIQSLNRIAEHHSIESRIQRASRLLNTSEIPEGNRYFQQMELALQQQEFLNKAPDRSSESILPEIAKNLELGFLSKAVKIRFAMQNTQLILGIDYDWEYLRQIWPLLIENISQYPPHLRAYIHLCVMYGESSLEEETAHYASLRSLLGQENLSISVSELRSIYKGTLNYCSKQINLGEKGYLRDYFELNKAMIPLGILCNEQGVLSPWPFKNLITVALRLGEIDWVEKFIDSHLPQVSKDQQTDALHYNKGLLLFFQKDFEAARKHLLLLLQSCQDVFYNLDARAYLLRIYFELEDDQAMESLLHSFRMYIHRNKLISESHREKYLSFTRYFRRFLNLPVEDEARIAAFRAELENSDKNQSGIDWILSKLGQPASN